ncbi:MAG: hypothetical protein PHY55_04620 [Bacteroidales bacterium]|nr:hypothetical protein [Bacteroidales bacterium]
MELILKNKQVNYEYNEDGTTKSEKVLSSNFEVSDGEEQKGNVNISERSVSLNIWNIDLSFEEIKTKVETFIDSLEVEEL